MINSFYVFVNHSFNDLTFREDGDDNNTLLKLDAVTAPLLYSPETAANAVLRARLYFALMLFRDSKRRDELAARYCEYWKARCGDSGLDVDAAPLADAFREITPKDLNEIGISKLFPFAVAPNGHLCLDGTELVRTLIEDYRLKWIDGTIAHYNGAGYVFGADAVWDLAVMLCSLSGVKPPHDAGKFFERISLNIKVPFSSASLIAVGNGIIRLDDGGKIALMPHSPDYFLPLMSPIDYILDIEQKRPDAARTLDGAMSAWANGDKDLERLLYEICGLTLFNSMKWKTGFLLYGRKDCGKSSFLSLVEGLAGDGNCARLSLTDAGERFRTALLMNKTVWNGDESMGGTVTAGDAAMLKKLISGERLPSEHKGRDAETFANRAKLIAAVNNLPKTDDPALYNRLMIVPFNHVFPKGETSNDAMTNKGKDLAKDPAVMQVLLFRAVRALSEMLERDRNGDDPFSPCAASDYCKRKSLGRTLPVFAWLDAMPMEGLENKAWHITTRKGQGNNTPYSKCSKYFQDVEFAEWAKGEPDVNVKLSRDEFERQVVDYFHGIVRLNDDYSYFHKTEFPEGKRVKENGYFKSHCFELVNDSVTNGK